MILPFILLFILGTIFGSFLSVLIYRIHTEKKGIFFGKSECPHCHKKLKNRDLIPIISFIINKGKCRMCKKPIGLHYLLLEIVTGAALAFIFLIYPFIEFTFTEFTHFSPEFLLPFIYNSLISLFLIGIFFYDFLYMEIPEIFTFPAIGFVFIATFFLPEPGLFSMVIGGVIAAIFFGFQVWVSKETWLGIGDMQVGILMGMFLGWERLIVGIIIAYLLGTILSVVLLSAKIVKGKSKIPFAPFLVSAMFIMIFFGDFIYKLYLSTFF